MRKEEGRKDGDLKSEHGVSKVSAFWNHRDLSAACPACGEQQCLWSGIRIGHHYDPEAPAAI